MSDDEPPTKRVRTDDDQCAHIDDTTYPVPVDALVIIAWHLPTVEDLSYYALVAHGFLLAARWVYSSRRRKYGNTIPRELAAENLPLAWSWRAAVTSIKRIDDAIAQGWLLARDATRAAAACGYFGAFRYLVEDCQCPPQIVDCAEAAAANDCVEFIGSLGRYAARKGWRDVTCISSVMRAAVRHDRVATVKYLLERGDFRRRSCGNTRVQAENGDRGERATTATLAAGLGALQVLAMLVTSTIPKDCIEAAALNGHLRILEWAENHRALVWDAALTEAVLKGNHAHVIDWVIARCSRDAIVEITHGGKPHVASHLLVGLLVRGDREKAYHVYKTCMFSGRYVWDRIARIGRAEHCDVCAQWRIVDQHPGWSYDAAIEEGNQAYIKWRMDQDQYPSETQWKLAVYHPRIGILDLFMARCPEMLTRDLHRQLVSAAVSHSQYSKDSRRLMVRQWLAKHAPS